MISKNNVIIQIVVKKTTKEFLKKLAKHCNTSMSSITNYIIESQIIQLNSLEDKKFVELLQKIIKEFQNENN